ncbi:putative Acid phosphatase [Rosa chinensis]|uniref:Putative Acid phosphatase n=1 Tax=Rosa chinensis TaxID=74649 RepID=A0A2P6R3I5_ROSCH|nr:putative Acid phosphatase [Rosa chinensis]
MQLLSFRRQFMILTACLSLCLVAKAEFQRLQQQTNDEGSLKFFVVGDWSRRGLYNQSQVAAQTLFSPPAGDNFYDDGLKGVYDPAFKESFSNICNAQSLKKPYWFSVLGNHDYRGNVLAQLNPLLKRIDSRWFCYRSFHIGYAGEIHYPISNHVNLHINHIGMER